MEETTSVSACRGQQWLQGTKDALYVCMVSGGKDPQMKCDSAVLFTGSHVTQTSKSPFLYLPNFVFNLE